MSDARTLENRFLGAVQALLSASQAPRNATKALCDVPGSAEAYQAVQEALLGGVQAERLRSIAKASQGDSRRGREVAARLSEWLDGYREVAKAMPEPEPEADPEERHEALRTTIKAMREGYEGREVAKASSSMMGGWVAPYQRGGKQIMGYFKGVVHPKKIAEKVAAHKASGAGSMLNRWTSMTSSGKKQGAEHPINIAHAATEEALEKGHTLGNGGLHEKAAEAHAQAAEHMAGYLSHPDYKNGNFAGEVATIKASVKHHHEMAAIHRRHYGSLLGYDGDMKESIAEFDKAVEHDKKAKAHAAEK